MLDGAGDAEGDVEVGRDGRAGLADLRRVLDVAGIDRGARGPDSASEGVGANLSRDPRPRPPATTTFAVRSSGRPEGRTGVDDSTVAAAPVTSTVSVSTAAASTAVARASIAPCRTVTIGRPPSTADVVE